MHDFLELEQRSISCDIPVNSRALSGQFKNFQTNFERNFQGIYEWEGKEKKKRRTKTKPQIKSDESHTGITFNSKQFYALSTTLHETF